MAHMPFDGSTGLFTVTNQEPKTPRFSYALPSIRPHGRVRLDFGRLPSELLSDGREKAGSIDFFRVAASEQGRDAIACPAYAP